LAQTICGQAHVTGGDTPDPGWHRTAVDPQRLLTSKEV
jgi:hypothetical protein